MCFNIIWFTSLCLSVISQGLQYIHSMGLVHLDIKPDNIFISSVHDVPVSVPPHAHNSIQAIAEDMVAHRDDDAHQQFVYKIGKVWPTFSGWLEYCLVLCRFLSGNIVVWGCVLII